MRNIACLLVICLLAGCSASPKRNSFLSEVERLMPQGGPCKEMLTETGIFSYAHMSASIPGTGKIAMAVAIEDGNIVCGTANNGPADIQPDLFAGGLKVSWEAIEQAAIARCEAFRRERTTIKTPCSPFSRGYNIVYEQRVDGGLR